MCAISNNSFKFRKGKYMCAKEIPGLIFKELIESFQVIPRKAKNMIMFFL